jgi:hypothetical protein
MISDAGERISKEERQMRLLTNMEIECAIRYVNIDDDQQRWVTA